MKKIESNKSVGQSFSFANATVGQGFSFANATVGQSFSFANKNTRRPKGLPYDVVEKS